jgi:acetate kinase
VNVLVFNVGSTTLKYACIDTTSGSRLKEGLVDRIGQVGGDAADHLTAANVALEAHSSIQLDAIGHRVVQGGDLFIEPTLVTESSLKQLAKLDALAPLHNPPARAVLDAMVARGLATPQVMVFDTAYFASLPPNAYRYAVPENIYRDHGVRRYGAHGTSHRFVTETALAFLAGESRSTRLISLHLGGGASVTASVGGVAVETSMGMTPLEGLVMATRTGDIDPSVPLHLIRNAGMSPSEVDKLLNKQSGLLGLCGEVDMRAILKRYEQGDGAARLAIDVYVHRLVKYIGGYTAVLGGLDALLFTAGVGENSHVIRELVTTPLAFLGLKIDPAKNANRDRTKPVVDVSETSSPIRTLVVATNEELAIAQQTERLVLALT